MVFELKLRKVGNSVAAVLPKAALTRLNLGHGDVLYLTGAKRGGFRLTFGKPNFARKIREAKRLSRRYHTLKELIG